MEAEVYYWKDIEKMVELMYKEKPRYPTCEEISTCWVKLPISFKVTDESEKSLNKVYEELNIETNPMGTPEMQQWIRDNKLRHTSMSVGDIIFLGKNFYICKTVGWKKLEKKCNIEGKKIKRREPVYKERKGDE